MPNDQILSTDSPIGEIDQFTRIVDLAKNQIGQKVKTILDDAVNKYLPQEFRLKLIHEAATQISNDSLKNLTQYPNITSADRSKQYHEAIQKALNAVDQINSAYSTLVPQKTKQQLETELKNLQELQDPQKVKEISQAAFQQTQHRAQNITSSQNLANKIHGEKEDLFGLNKKDTANLIKDIRNQPSVINNPTQENIQQAINSIVNQPDSHGLTPQQAEQISKELSNHLDDLHHYSLTATDPLPSSTPFTPWQPKITPLTLRQAKALNASPLAVAYTTSGFSATDPRLSKDLQQEVAALQLAITDPTNPAHKLSLPGVLQAYKLKPQVFLSQNYYQPIYQKIQNLKIKSNQVLDEPWKVYQSVNQQYLGFKDAYQTLKQDKPLGWIIAPRFRTKLAYENAKIKTKRWSRYQLLKTQKGRQAYRNIQKPVNSAKEFWHNWSPRGITRRSSQWLQQKTIAATAKLGGWLISKGATKLGGSLTKIAALAAETGSIIGIPLVLLQLSIGFAKSILRKFKEKRLKDRDIADQSEFISRTIQTILNGLKTLLTLLTGLTGSIVGAILGGVIGLLLGGPFGAAIGIAAGWLIGGSLGTIFGMLLPKIALGLAAAGSHLTAFFSTLTASSVITPLVIGTTVGIGGTILLTQQNLKVITSAFHLPLPPDQNRPSYASFQCLKQDEPPPTPDNIIYSNDKKYAFPVAPYYYHTCYHKTGAVATLATDIGTGIGQTATDPPVANPVIAYTSGTIEMTVENDLQGGKYLILKGDDGRAYYYAHNCAIFVKPGQRVNVGQVIATTDKTGIGAAITVEHLHFAILDNAGPDPYFSNGGGNICPAEDFIEKFGNQVNSCDPTKLCQP